LLWRIQGVPMHACVGKCITEWLCLSECFLSPSEFWWYLVSGVYTKHWWTNFIYTSHWSNISAAVLEAKNQIHAKVSETIHVAKTCTWHTVRVSLRYLTFYSRHLLFHEIRRKLNITVRHWAVMRCVC
jgi:hypothetical protein